MGRRVRALMVRLTLLAISQTIIMDSHHHLNPINIYDSKLILPLSHLLQAYMNQDPASLLALAAPIELIEATKYLY